MAASGWSYFVPFQPDMDRVLEDLRADVLARCDYQEVCPDLSFLDEVVEFFEAEESAREELMDQYGLEPLRWVIDQYGFEGLREWLESQESDYWERVQLLESQESDYWERVQRSHNELKPKRRSIEELRALQCLSDSGTHSILDIDRVSPSHADFAIYPLSNESLVSLFATDRPSRSDVKVWRERDDQSCEDLYDRWQGFYVTVFRDGEPDEIYIEGASGD